MAFVTGDLFFCVCIMGEFHFGIKCLLPGIKRVIRPGVTLPARLGVFFIHVNIMTGSAQFMIGNGLPGPIQHMT